MSTRRIFRPTVGTLLACLTLLAALAQGSPCRAGGLPLAVFDVQYTADPSGDSPYVWQIVSLEGVVTATFFEGFTIADAPGAWNSIFVADWSQALDVGDLVSVTGLVYENYGMTTIVEVSELAVLGSGNAATPTSIPVSDVAQEAYESVLIEVGNPFVGALLDFGEWAITDFVGFALVDDLNDYVYFPRLLDALDSLTGVVFYTYGNFKIEPRNTQDILAATLPHYLLRGTIVTMNDTRDVLPDSYVEVLADLIVGIHDVAPYGLPVVETGGLIFPGLIDAHNHPRANVLDLIPFGSTFEDRSEWRGTQMYADFSDQYDGILHYGGSWAQDANMVKVAEMRALSSGTTTMQGINCNNDYDAPWAHQGLGIDNAERFPSLILSAVFPLEIPLETWMLLLGENWQRFAIHLAEGTNANALGEFRLLTGTGLMDRRTTIIHGVPLRADEWSMMAAAGAHLVWSPMSNWTLYGDTADVPGALAAGVNVALAPDWTPSGASHVLGEMQFAAGWDEINWGDAIAPIQHAEQVTRNAALALANQARLGQVAPGFRANLMVVPGDASAPYDALLEAHPGSVLLTVANGRPMYGDPEFHEAINMLGEAEEVAICGTPKLFSITVDAHSIDESDKPVSEILDELTAAWHGTEPKVSDLLLLEDTTEPRPLLEGPVCASAGGEKQRNQFVVHAFDDCGRPQISIDEVVVRNGGGNIVMGQGIVTVEGNRVVIDTNGSGWSVELTATMTDSSGNAATATFVRDLPKCG